ncbi:MAG: (Fe-S)-binding protein, partial [Dehalococcoidia bacterium]
MDRPHVDEIWEKPEIEIEGVKLTDRWNRMFSERALIEYSPEAMEKITSMEGAESLGWCYQCGKCTPVCPVDVVGDYSPRKIVHKVQRGLDLFTDPDLWLCTTCMNCLRVCPKEVNMIDIMPAVREQAVLNGNMPPELAKAFENTFRYGNPLGEPAQKRADWAKEAGVPVPIIKELGQQVDVLWYVECYPAYHPRGHDASQALARLFNTLGVDFAILGVEEKCTGDSQRLGGEKGLFEWLTEYNLKTLGKYQFNKIVVTDPHAFNAIKNQWPKYGGDFEVYHYTQFLASMVDKIPFKKKLDY